MRRPPAATGAKVHRCLVKGAATPNARLNDAAPMDLFVFLDCEMTGLDPDVDKITEITMIAARARDLRVLGEFSSVIHYDAQFLRDHLSDWCKRVHRRNGLLSDICASSSALTVQNVETSAVAFLRQYGAANIFLCGNNVGHDRRFVERYMSRLAELFHRDIIELNVFLRCAQAWNPTLREHCPKKVTPPHRSLTDARSSFNLALYFHHAMLCAAPPPPYVPPSLPHMMPFYASPTPAPAAAATNGSSSSSLPQTAVGSPKKASGAFALPPRAGNYGCDYRGPPAMLMQHQQSGQQSGQQQHLPSSLSAGSMPWAPPTVQVVAVAASS
jgi:oligoribonuclease